VYWSGSRGQAYKGAGRNIESSASLSEGSEYRGQHEVFATTSSISPTSDTVWRRCGLSELDDEPVRFVLEAGDDDGARNLPWRATEEMSNTKDWHTALETGNFAVSTDLAAYSRAGACRRAITSARMPLHRPESCRVMARRVRDDHAPIRHRRTAGRAHVVKATQ